ncbi:hypothetical protein QEZ48_19715 [Aquamicrobium lusatiense]|uniref:hypothetical protein n=1 Tax=Aquamicrobium lusatiense TaxID=89772 RepID=UPI0024566431|nr:hypothetical protein [Aquamicrobium lusatiense]MDH4993046.1 hypothetical protein [Aquamicrobium lusatiense]
MMLVDPFRFAGSSPATLEFMGDFLKYEETDAITFSGINLGDPRDDRRIIVTIHVLRASSIPAVVEGYVDGAQATIHSQEVIQFTNTYYGLVGIMTARLPSGNIGSITIKFASEFGAQVRIGVYNAKNIQNDHIFDINSKVSNVTAVEHSLNISVPKDGIVLAACVVGSPNYPVEIEGTVTNYSDIFGDSSYKSAGGGDVIADSDHDYNIVFRLVGGPSFAEMSGVFLAASFR